MKTITRKVFSYCVDFTDEEQSILLDETSSCGVYIEYTANTKGYLELQGFENDIIANKLIELGCKENEDVLINMDY